jgi:uncharacterized membrane protein
MSFLDVVATVSIGLMIGTEFAVSVFVNPVLWKLPEDAQARAISRFAGRLGAAMPFWYAGNLIFLIAEVMINRHEPKIGLLIAATAIWILVIVFTILFLVPINNRMTRLDSDSFSPKDRQEHRKWDSLHRLRVTAIGVALVCFLLTK